MKKLTEEQAKYLYSTVRWDLVAPEIRAEFQLREERLCMPFALFHEAVECALGRAVWTHEFADPATLLSELYGERPRPSFAEIVAKLPGHVQVVYVEPR